MINNTFLASQTSQSTAKRGSKRYALYVFWVLFAIGFLNYLDRSVLTGAANVVAHELGLGIDSLGYLASAFLIVYTVCIIPMGLWADRAKRKNVVAISVAFWSIATAFTALSFNFLSLFLSRMLLGFGEAGYFPAGTALPSDYFSREKRSRIMSWWSVGQLAGIPVWLCYWRRGSGPVCGKLAPGLYLYRHSWSGPGTSLLATARTTPQSGR